MEEFSKKKNIALLGVLTVVVALLFGRILFNGFVYDDLFLITSNQVIKSTVNPVYYFTHAEAAQPQSPVAPDIYRPLGIWFFSLQYHLFGLDPFYFHLVNLLLHAVNTVLFFLLLKKIFSALGRFASGGKNAALSFFGALFFGIHPIMTESVAWASQQSALWSWFFSFLALIVSFSENRFLDKNWRRITLIVIFSFAAVFSKELTAILPLVFILGVFIFKLPLKAQIGKFAAITIPVALALILRQIFLGSIAFSQIGLEELWGIGRWPMFLTMLHGFAYYLRLLIWPHPLSVNYDSFPLANNFFNFPVIISVAFLLLIIFIAIKFWRKCTLFSLGILWIFIVLLPVSNFIFPTKQIIGERHLYFAVPGFVIAVLAVIDLMFEKYKNYKKFLLPALVSLMVMILLIFSKLTFTRLGDWKSEFTLWKHEIEIKPNDWRNQMNFAYALEKENKSEEAIEHYYKSFEFAGNINSLSQSVKSAALAHLRMGETAEAKKLFQALLNQSPADSTIIFELGQVYLKEKDYDNAVNAFRYLYEKFDSSDTNLFFLLLSEKLMGQSDAIIKIGIGKIKNPAFREIVFLLLRGKEEMERGRWAEAAAFFDAGIKIYSPQFVEPYLWLGESLEMMNEKTKAFTVYQNAALSFPFSIDAAQGVERNNKAKQKYGEF